MSILAVVLGVVFLLLGGIVVLGGVIADRQRERRVNGAVLHGKEAKDNP